MKNFFAALLVLFFCGSLPAKAEQLYSSPNTKDTSVYNTQTQNGICSDPNTFSYKASCYNPTPNRSSSIGSNPSSLSLSTRDLGLLGPFSLGVTYSRIGDYIFQGQWTQAININNAYNLAFELGPKQRRISGTIAHAFAPQQRLKLTTEYLMQDLNFDFVAGSVDRWIGQAAYGLTYEYILPTGPINDVNLNLTYSKAKSKDVADLFYSDQYGRYFEDIQRIAGGENRSASIGIDLLPTNTSLLGLKLDYDALRYDTRYVPTQNASGLGTTISLDQLLSDKSKVHFLASLRKPYRDYQAELDFLLPTKHGTRLEMGLTGEYIVRGANLPNDSRIGVNFRYAFGGDYSTPKASYKLNSRRQANDDLVSWSGVPAVHMAQVLAIKDELFRQLLHVNTIFPAYCSVNGCDLVQILGTGFLAPFHQNNNNAASQAAYNTNDNANTNYPITISFGEKSVTGHVITDNEIHTSAPPHPVGTVDVKILSPDGQVITLPNAFTYVDSILGKIIPSTRLPNNLADGGTLITAYGEGFPVGETAVVSFDDIKMPPVKIISSTEISVLSPSFSAPHGANVVVTTSLGRTKPIIINYLHASFEDSSPKEGPIEGGTKVTLKGGGFSDNQHTSVKFGGADATVSVLSETELTAITPPAPSRQAGPVDVVVTTKNSNATGGSTDTIVAGFTYRDKSPHIDSLDNSVGLNGGGKQVTINGQNFDGNNLKVYFNTLDITGQITSHDANHIVITTPSLDIPDKEVDTVKVHTDAGDSNTDKTFTYYALLIDPASGKQGDQLTITAHSDNADVFSAGNVTVTINGQGIALSTQATNKIVTNPIPAGQGTVDVKVINQGSDSAIGSFTYVPPASPHIDSLDNSVGLNGGGKQVTINGQNFDGNNLKVYFNTLDITGQIKSHDANHIVITTPNRDIPDKEVDTVKVHTDAGDSNTDKTFTYYALLITPASGKQGDQLTITAHSDNADVFSAGNVTVTINGQDITPTSHTTNKIVTNPIPTGQDTVDVKVVNQGSDSATGSFTYVVPQPTVTSISPNMGSIGSGTKTVSVIGTNFVKTGPSASTVKLKRQGFPDITGQNVNVQDDKDLTFNLDLNNLPANPIGAWDVVVNNGSSQSSPISPADLFNIYDKSSVLLSCPDPEEFLVKDGSGKVIDVKYTVMHADQRGGGYTYTFNVVPNPPYDATHYPTQLATVQYWPNGAPPPKNSRLLCFYKLLNREEVTYLEVDAYTSSGGVVVPQDATNINFVSMPIDPKQQYTLCNATLPTNDCRLQFKSTVGLR